MLRRLLLTLAALAGLAGSTPTFAQALTSAIPVASCNSKSYTLGVPSALTMTTGGNLCDTGSGGGGGSNAAAGPTGSAPPASASYNGLNVGGTLRGQTGVNPSGSVYAAQTDLTSVGGTSIALGQTTMSASLPVAFASNQSALTVAQATASSLNAQVVGNTAAGGADSGNGVKVSGVYNTSLPTLTSGWRSDLQVDSRGELMAQLSSSGSPVGVIASSTDGVGAGSIALVVSGFNRDYNGTSWDRLYSATAAAGTTGTGVQAAGAMGFDGTNYRRLLTDTNGNLWTLQALQTTGGWTPKLLNALSTTAVAVKASGGQLGMLQCYNPNASQEYVQVYNIAQGSVTVGTSTPLESIAIAPTSTGGFVMAAPGQQFGTAITVAATTTATGGSAPGTALDCNASYN